MEFFYSILSVALISAIGIMSPGPDFLAVTHAAITTSRKSALAVAMGVILGNGVWAGAALVGIGSLFLLFPAFFIFLKFFGALYLCYLGCKLIKGARSELSTESLPRSFSTWHSVRKGFANTMSNPKAAIFYASALSSLAPSSAGFFELAAMLLTVMLVASIWFGFVVMVLSTPSASAVFRSMKVYFESIFGILLIAFGIRQICSK